MCEILRCQMMESAALSPGDVHQGGTTHLGWWWFVDPYPGIQKACARGEMSKALHYQEAKDLSGLC